MIAPLILLYGDMFWICFVVSVIHNLIFPIFIFSVMVMRVFELWCVTDQQKDAIDHNKKKSTIFWEIFLTFFYQIFFSSKLHFFFLKSSETYQKKISLISDEIFFFECIKSTIPQNINIREFVLLFCPFYSAPSALSIMSEWFCIIYKK